MLEYIDINGYDGINPFWVSYLEKLGISDIDSARKHSEKGGSNYVLKKSTRNDTEHLRSLLYLINNGLLDEYIEMIRKLRVVSTYNNARYFYQFDCLRKLMREHISADLSIIEIGPAGGILGLMLMKQLPVARYYFVDLPQMLPLSLFTIEKYARKRTCLLFDGDTCHVENNSVVFVPAQNFDKITDNSCNVAINTFSFQEMDKNIRDGYIGGLYNILEPHSLFFNINVEKRWMTMVDGSSYKNMPDDYPYSADSKVVCHVEDPFHGYVVGNRYKRCIKHAEITGVK